VTLSHGEEAFFLFFLFDLILERLLLEYVYKKELNIRHWTHIGVVNSHVFGDRIRNSGTHGKREFGAVRVSGV